MLRRIPRAPSMDASSSGTGDGGPGGVGGPALADGRTDAHDRRPGVGHDHLHVGEVGVDQAGHRDEVGDATYTLEQDLIGHLEGVDHAGLVVGDGEQPVVGDDDEGVDLLLENLDALLGLHGAAPALEGEGTGHHADGQRPQALGDLGHDGCGAGTGPAALASGDEDHVRALERLFDIRPVLFGRLPAHLRVAARAQAAGQLAPDVQLEVGVAHQQRLGVGVGRDELDVAQARIDHAVHGVDPSATDTHHLDHCEVVALGRNGRHELPRLRADRRPIALWCGPARVTAPLRPPPSLNLWKRLTFTDTATWPHHTEGR